MARNTPFSLKGYSFSDGKFTFNGIELPGIKAVNITTQQEKVNNPGAGVYAVSRGRGWKNVEGSIDMDIETAKIIKDKSPVASATGDMTDVEPGIFTSTFDDGNGNIIKVQITAVEFKNDGMETAVDDTEIVRTYDVIGGIFRVFE